jgi:fructose-1,6-bisphosphatase I
VGSLVADIHRNLMGGGVFYYPADHRQPDKPRGKLRLLYEVTPISFLIEQAGGYASNGYGPIRDVQPAELHQRSPFFVGNKELVEKAEEFIARYDKGPA